MCHWLGNEREETKGAGTTTPFLSKRTRRVSFSRPVGDRQWAVQLRPPRGDPALAGGVFQEGGVEVGDDHRVFGLPGLGENASVWIEDHRVAGANLVVVHAHAIAEDDEHSVVVRAGGQPAQQPAAALVAAKLGLDGRGIGVTVVPQRAVNHAHDVGIVGGAAAGLVRAPGGSPRPSAR